MTMDCSFNELFLTMKRLLLLIGVCVCMGCSQFGKKEEANGQQVDREYVLDAKIVGFVGVGGNIDGMRNPTLKVKRGERVKINIVNGELMAHDIVLEKLDIRSEPILEVGDTTSVYFIANDDDIYFCSIPGHHFSMRGKITVVENIESTVFIDEGVTPRKDGRPLNLGFERGNLQDWKAQGNAFGPKSVTYEPAPWYPDSLILRQSGDYYVSSGGTLNHSATGTLTSVSFEVTHPWASFWITGGSMEGLRVELRLADTDEVFFKSSGYVTDWNLIKADHAVFRPMVVDLSKVLGKEIYIKLIDEETGTVNGMDYWKEAWAHISFDDFRFHEERPMFQNELRVEDILPARDFTPHAGLSAHEVAKVMDIPEGFSVKLAASEPDIVRPIAFALDDRGRLWVVEAHTYPIRAEEGKGRDRILIFEDTNGDGVLDSRKVFMEGLNLVSGIELGFGGVWIGAAPYLMFIPYDEKTDKPTGAPTILLDGWDTRDTHETLNTFRWGPDGWLYGTHGVFNHSNIGKPGASDDERQKMNAGVWRYHPTRHEFEVYAHGVSNPWGLDFNDYGHVFVTACVIPHLHQVILGGRHERQWYEHFNPHTYGDIKNIADHVHWVGDRGPHAGNFRSASAGGGHAHAGAMFYLGNKHWGIDRDAIFMNNIHGHRVNVDLVKRKASGYMASHEEDFINTNDFWSQWLNFQITPSGTVYAIDWYDKNQCHANNPDLHDKTLGRIFRISHSQDKWVSIDLKTKTDMELVDYQLHENEWYVTHGRRILQERGATKEVHDALWKIFKANPDETRKLRVLWALRVTDGLSEGQLLALLDHEGEYVRSWAVQFLAEPKAMPDGVRSRLESLAKSDTSALVRLHLAAAAQRLPMEQRWTLLENLSLRDGDYEDPNIPYMIWYAFEPLAELDANRAIEIAKRSKQRHALPYMVRRVAAIEGDSKAAQVLQKLKGDLEKKRNHTEEEHGALSFLAQLAK